MLTVNMLQQNPALSGLTTDQLNAIAQMSQNDENTVIGTKIGALHGQYDSDILGVTGIKKNENEKSYDYAKRVLGSFKAKAESVTTLQTSLNEANAKVQDLQDKLAKNAGNETLTQQLKDTKAQVSQLQAKLTAKETELTTKTSQFEKDLKNAHVDYAFQSAIQGLKFKSGISEAVQNIMLSSAKNEVLAKGTPDFVDNGGTKVLVFRDANGTILNNPTSLAPSTVNELLMETSLKDVLDMGKTQPGGGTQPPTGGQGGGSVIDLSGAKTQIEADQMIEGYLLKQGLTRDSEDFASQMLQIRTDSKVTELPIR